jgi:hypothetical protein
LGVALVTFLGLRDFSFTDYEAEVKPAIDHLVAGDLSDFMRALPSYAGAVLLEAPFASVGHALGGDADLWAWRGQALPGLALLFGLGVALGRRVMVCMPGRPGIAWGAFTALSISGAPFALLALQTGHTEEPLVAGMTVASVLLASKGKLGWAGTLVGLATVAKPWAVIVVPVVLLSADDRRGLARSVGACLAAGALLAAPSVLAGGSAGSKVTSHQATTGIFKPDNVFWFAGSSNPRWAPLGTDTTARLFETDPSQAAWAQRLEPAWAAQVSHPAIVAFAILLAVGYWRRRRAGERREDLLLLLSAVCWWRCLLDTWNVHYYALAALVALVAWEAHRGRPPVAGLTVTLVAWSMFQLFPASDITPDVHTAIYLAWAVPLGIAMTSRLLAPDASLAALRAVGGPLAARMPTLARLVAPA